MNDLLETAKASLISRLERVPLREVWRHEALRLHTWLQQNIDVLNDALGLELENVEREQAAEPAASQP